MARARRRCRKAAPGYAAVCAAGCMARVELRPHSVPYTAVSCALSTVQGGRKHRKMQGPCGSCREETQPAVCAAAAAADRAPPGSSRRVAACVRLRPHAGIEEPRPHPEASVLARVEPLCHVKTALSSAARAVLGCRG